MESLAYIHLALAYEAHPDNGSVAVVENVKLFEGLNRQKLSGRSWIYMLSLAVALGVLGVASSALAELLAGSSGSEVMVLQQRLHSLGYFNGRFTGNFDSATTAAVIRFQKAKGLTPDGIVGAGTQEALRNQRRRNVASSRSSTNRVQTAISNSSNQTRRNVAVRRSSTNRVQTAISNSPKQPRRNVAVSRSPLRIVQPSSNASRAQPRLAVRNTDSDFLQPGDRGIEVRNLQQRLKQAGFYSGPIDGVFSPATEAALRQFQQTNRLAVDGLAGPQTQAVLKRVTRFSANQTPKRIARSPILQPYQTKPEVETLQLRLKQLGYYNGQITGNLNSQTKEALIQFQRDRGLEADGIPGRDTFWALEKATGRESVQALQRRLQENGFYSGPIDGDLGPETKAAIAAAQQSYGISASEIMNQRF